MSKPPSKPTSEDAESVRPCMDHQEHEDMINTPIDPNATDDDDSPESTVAEIIM
jgi:hypothetical protein